MAITILLEITVPASSEPTMTSFVFLSNISDKIFGLPFLLKVWLFPLFFDNVAHDFIDERLKVNFEYLFGKFFKGILNTMIKSIPPNLNLNMF